MILLKSQKTLLYNLIENSDFSPSSFSLSEIQHDQYEGPTTFVEYNHSDFYFDVWVNPRDEAYFYEYSPGSTKLLNVSSSSVFDGVVYVFNTWLNNLKREIEEVDKWELLKEGIPDFKLANTKTQEGKFSYEEVTLIESRVFLLKEKIKEIPLTTEQFNALNTKLDYCIELAKTATKFDWASYFIGVITNIIINLSVTPENAAHVWEAVKHTFSHFLLM